MHMSLEESNAAPTGVFDPWLTRAALSTRGRAKANSYQFIGVCIGGCEFAMII
jgi:hypothetical protein